MFVSRRICIEVIILDLNILDYFSGNNIHIENCSIKEIKWPLAGELSPVPSAKHGAVQRMVRRGN